MVLGIAKDSPKNTKEAIILILSNEWPLSAKKTYNLVRKKGLSVTYQAVFKTIKQLVEEGIIQKDGKDYRLDVNWLKRMDKESERILGFYEKKGLIPPERVLANYGSAVEFENLMDFFHYMIDIFKEMSKFQDERGLFCHFRHLWWAMTTEGEKFERFKDMVNSYSHGHFLCRNDTPMDRMIFNYYNSFKTVARVKLGVDCAKDCDLFVSGDYIAQVFFDDSLKRGLDKFYKLKPGLKTDIFSKFFQLLFFKKVKITLLVNKSPALAERIKQEALKLLR